ncbi:MAG: hypothetical protein AVDCRST_MAG48-1562 [uncultured Friedmanniella sp.]|uniref:Uncharacterized protein n=1 Tax=uncultured Friedmanniella sp. TaxID=335381 RepID=A0A6J4KGB6_9ACTN|nr:MAG: hypothetical protein AVDCRST_MAG48-1562 [uncultured Friedmanniella sp.]
MLEWATFGAAALAAVGTFLGPLVAYRSVTRTAAATRLQADVDRYISLALEPDAVTCRLGIAQLQYLLNAGDLSESQLNAVSEAIGAGLRRLQEEMEADPDAVVAVELGAADLDPAALDPPRDTGGPRRGAGAG